MSLKIFLMGFALLAFIDLGACIKCYICAGTQSSECAKGKTSSMSVINDCEVPKVPFFHVGVHRSSGENVQGLQAVCVRATSTDFEPKLVERGCGVFPATIDPCQFLENAHFENCKYCKTDKCNLFDDEDTNEV